MIRVATDWHLWKYDDKSKTCKRRKSYDAILADAKKEMQPDDIFLYLGDLTDGEFSTPNKIEGILSDMPGYKIMVLGNNDTLDRQDYLNAGFDKVVDCASLGNLLFTHHPCYVGPGQLNVHGHNHGKPNPNTSAQNIDAWTKDRSVIPLEDVLTGNMPDTAIDIASNQWREIRKGNHESYVSEPFDLKELYLNGVDGHPVDESVFPKEKARAPEEEKEARKTYLKEIDTICEAYFNETLEYRLSSHPKGKYITLYHGSPTQGLKYIEPNSFNRGTRFSKTRMSSFWAIDPKVALLMGYWSLLAKNIPNFNDKNWYMDFDRKKFVIPEMMQGVIYRVTHLKNPVISLYIATVPAKYIGRGHDIKVDEYTLDMPVAPHHEARVPISKIEDTFLEVVADRTYFEFIAKHGESHRAQKKSFRDRLVYLTGQPLTNRRTDYLDDMDAAKKYGSPIIDRQIRKNPNFIIEGITINEVLFQDFEDAKDFETDDDVAKSKQDPDRETTYRIKFKKKQVGPKNELSVDESVNPDTLQEASDDDYVLEETQSIIALTQPLMQDEMHEAMMKMLRDSGIEESSMLEAVRGYKRKKVQNITKGQYTKSNARRNARKPKDELDSSSIFEGIRRSVSIDKANSMIVIKGINYQKTLARIKNMYNTKRVNKLFDPTYSKWSLFLYNNEQITKGEMKIIDLKVPLFFALELQQIFYDLADYYQLSYYEDIANLIQKKTWISNVDKPVQQSEVNLSALKQFTIQPLDYQMGYINEYFTITRCYNFDGHILTFKPGYGKTFTAVCIAEVAPDVDHMVVVCPNSIKENWAYEIKSYYKKYQNNEQLWKDEVYVEGISRYKFNKAKNKWIIVNQESISKIYSKVSSDNTMIIVDESHYFRNMDGVRVKELLKLKDLTKATEILMMSGTPIKASPDEIIPALLMIDPMFTYDLAKIYKSAFATDNTALERVIKSRFGIVMYSVEGDVLKLPERHIENLQLSVKNDERYALHIVHAKISERYQYYYAKLGTTAEGYKEEFREIVKKYSTADKDLTRQYIKFVDDGSNHFSVHESKADIYRSFLKEYVYPNIDNSEEKKHVKDVVANYVYMSAKARGLAMGEIMPPLYNGVNIQMWDENEQLLLDMINNNLKKTIIFTPYVKVAQHITDRLEKNKIGVVKITGATHGNRMDLLQKFRKSDDIDVLVATDKTMGVGVTLVEASQVFFFGVPWRSSDFEQASDRVYRIGQTSEVFIYKVLLKCQNGYENITTRQNDVMEWSATMTSAYSGGSRKIEDLEFTPDSLQEAGTAIQRAVAYWGDEDPDPIYGPESLETDWRKNGDSKTGKVDEEDVDDISESISPSTKLYPVYITLFSNDTGFGFLIRSATHSDYTHATVSLDSTMNNMYSFNNVPYSGKLGFCRESIWSPQYRKNRFFTVYVTFVDKKGRDKIQKRIDNFVKNYDKYSYNTIGLFQYYLRFKNEKNHDENTKTRWFCSEFVAGCLDSSDETMGFENTFLAPEDLRKRPNVFNLGNFKVDTFDEDILKKRTAKAEAKFRKQDNFLLESTINEGAIVYDDEDDPVLLEAIKKAPRVSKKEIGKYTFNVDWKALFDNFKELFPKNDPNTRFDLFGLIITNFIVPSKTKINEVTSQIIAQMKRIANTIKGGFITLIDASTSVIFYHNDKGDGAFHYPDGEAIQEANNEIITEAATFAEVKSIVDRIPKSEHHYFYHGSRFKDSPYVAYREVAYKNPAKKTGGAFIEAYIFDDAPDIAILVIAAEPDARGVGLTDRLIKNAIKALKKRGVKKLIWRADNDNAHSIKLAERNGFVDKTDVKKNPDQKRYEMILEAAGSAPDKDNDGLAEVVKMNRMLNKFEYGLSTSGKKDIKTNATGKEYDNKYRLATPEQFLKQEGGICWDFAAYEAYHFKKYAPSLKYTAWYIVFDAPPYYPTHTFLTVKVGNYYVLPESSFRRIQGVWVSKSEMDLVNFIIHSMGEHTKGLLEHEYALFKYNALDRKTYGMGSGEFMNYIEKVGKEVHFKYNPNFNVTKLKGTKLDEAINDTPDDPDSDLERVDGTHFQLHMSGDPLNGDDIDDDWTITDDNVDENAIIQVPDRPYILIPILDNGHVYYETGEVKFFVGWLEDLYTKLNHRFENGEVTSDVIEYYAKIRYLIGALNKLIVLADHKVSQYTLDTVQQTIDTAETFLRNFADNCLKLHLDWKSISNKIELAYEKYKRQLRDDCTVDMALGKQALMFVVVR